MKWLIVTFLLAVCALLGVYIALNWRRWEKKIKGMVLTVLMILGIAAGSVIVIVPDIPPTGATSFGKTDIGGTAWSNLATHSGATKFTLPEDGTITTISLYISGTTGDAKVAIYSHDATNDEPEDKLVESVTESCTQDAWHNFDITDTPRSSGVHWLAWDNITDVSLSVQYTATGRTVMIYGNEFPANWGTSDWIGAREISIYANYTTEEGDETPPTYSNVATNTTVAQQPCKFSCKWHDNVELSGAIFGTNNSETWVNETWTPLSGKDDWLNVTKTLHSTNDTRVEYRWWCNDTSDNWGDTGIKYLIIRYEPWYLIDDGWINITKTDWKWCVKNGTIPNHFMYYKRHSETSEYQHSYWGFIWTEQLGSDSGNTFGGQGTVYLIYNDLNILIYKRVHGTAFKICQIYTFWKDKDYFAFETNGTLTNDKSFNQFEFGITFPTGYSWTYARSNYNDAERTDAGNLPFSYDIVNNNQEMIWQSMKVTDNVNESIGWILTYTSKPWLEVSCSSSGAAFELQYCTYFSTPSGNAAYRVKETPWSYQISTVVYPFYGDGSAWYQPIENLAENLYSNINKTLGYEALHYAYAQDAINARGTIANRMSVIHFQTTYNGFMLKNTTAFRYYPSDYYKLPLYMRATTSLFAYPDVALTNDSGTFNCAIYDDNPWTDSSKSSSTDDTLVWLDFSGDISSFGLNISVETWGDSDKFNITIRFRNKITQNIEDAWFYIRARNQEDVGNINFNEITADTTADYTINDPYSGWCGFLIKNLGEGNAHGIDFSSEGAKIYFVDNAAEQEYTPQEWWIKIMVWGHYGQITGEEQITAYHTYSNITDTTQHFPWSLSPDSLYIPYNIWNGTATFPIMTQIDSDTYNLTSIASGTKTFTVYLNTTIFPVIETVVDVTNWEYNSTTGNLTFTATWNGMKQIQIATVTHLTVGWNEISAWEVDVGYTLSEVNASLNFDNINWTTIIIDYQNGTCWELIWDQEFDEYYGWPEKIVDSPSDLIAIYCVEVATWTHEYP